MRFRPSLVLLCIIAFAPLASAQQQPNLTGRWTLPPDAPAGPGGKPAGAAGFGPEITIWHEGNTFAVTRTLGGNNFVVTHLLDGSETRSRTPGRLCEGDSETLWTAGWQEKAIVTTMVGTIPAGASTPIKMDVKAMFRAKSPEILELEMTYRVAGATEPRVVTTLYKKAGPPSIPKPPEAAAGTPASLKQVEWLAGTWIGTTANSAFEERWTPPGGGSMLAVARSLRNGVMNSFEFLCIVQRNGGLVYQAMPNGRQPATDFTLTKIEPNAVTFENPSHDFPKMIRYTLGSDGTLEAIVSGTDKQKPQVFRFKKQ